MTGFRVVRCRYVWPNQRNTNMEGEPEWLPEEEPKWRGCYFYWPKDWAPPAPGVEHRTEKLELSERFECGPGVYFYRSFKAAWSEAFYLWSIFYKSLFEIWEVESIGEVVEPPVNEPPELRKLRARGVRYVRRLASFQVSGERVRQRCGPEMEIP